MKNVIETFFEVYPKRSYNKRHIFLFPEESTNYAYYIVSGKVKKYFIDKRGSEAVIDLYGPGDVFPLSYLVNRTIENYYAESETDVVLRTAPLREFEKFLDTSVEADKELLKKVLLKRNQANNKLLHLMNSSAKQRLVYELLVEARKSGRPNDKALTLSINETELGSRAGLSRETVSRIMQELKKENLVNLKSKAIHIQDLLGLEQKIKNVS